MIKEQQLVPFETSILPEGPWLVFAPHPDDETLGMGGSLLLAAREGLQVTVVMLTDGALSASEATENLVATRMSEARQAARRLGVHEVQFWNHEDRSLTSTAQLTERVSKLVQALKPASVFFPSPLELHPDHRAAAAIVWQGLRKAGTAATAYAYEISVQGQVNLLVDITSVAEEKRSIISVYESQTKTNNYVEIALALNKSRTYTLPETIEYAEGFYSYKDMAAGHDLARHTLAALKPFWQLSYSSVPSLVSVIVRTRNRPNMLKNALRSVAEQTYPALEVVVVNDGGIDVTSVVHELDGLVSKIQYVSTVANQGRSVAGNTGLDHSTGRYLIFLDDDDWFLADHVAKLVDVLDKHENTGVAYTGIECMEEQAPGAWKRVHLYDDPYDPVRLLVNNFIPIHAALFRREFADAGCRLDESLTLNEDWDFWVQLSLNTMFRHVNGVSAVYRIGDGSGFGIIGDRLLVQRGEKAFFEKWRQLWDDEQLQQIIQYARNGHACRQLQSQYAARPQEHATCQQQLARLNAEMEQWARRCNSLEQSYSWQVTRPLRVTLELLCSLLQFVRSRVTLGRR